MQHHKNGGIAPWVLPKSGQKREHTNATFHVVALLRGFWPFVKKQDVNQFAGAYARKTLQFLHRGVAGPQNDKFDVIS